MPIRPPSEGTEPIAPGLLRHAAPPVRSEHPLAAEVRRLRALIACASDITFVLDRNGIVLDVSPGVLQHTGFSAAALIGRRPTELIPVDERRTSKTRLRDAVENRIPDPIEMGLQRLDGRRLEVEVRVKNLLHDPDVRGIVCHMRDVTERRRAEELLVAQTNILGRVVAGGALGDTMRDVVEMLSAQLGGSPTAFMMFDAAGEFIVVAYTELAASLVVAIESGLTAGAIVNHPASAETTVIAADADPAAPLELALAASGFGSAWLHPVHDPSRERMVGVLFIARPEAEEPARRERNSLAAASSIITLAVERFEAESELSHIGLHDPLTDLPNRRMFFERLQHSLTNADESTGTTAVLFVDLDHFKLVNDGLGHDAGDALLVEVGRRLRRVVRPDDTVARLGGDEFVIACNAVHDPADAARLADRVLEALARPISIDGREVLMTASVGIAISEGRDADEADAIMRRADAAMYRAKRLGRARVAGVE